MSTFSKVLAAVFLLFIAWYLYRTAKNSPQMFSKSNLLKGFNSMAVLALILIAFIWLCIVFLRH